MVRSTPVSSSPQPGKVIIHIDGRRSPSGGPGTNCKLGGRQRKTESGSGFLMDKSAKSSNGSRRREEISRTNQESPRTKNCLKRSWRRDSFSGTSLVTRDRADQHFSLFIGRYFFPKGQMLTKAAKLVGFALCEHPQEISLCSISILKMGGDSLGLRGWRYCSGESDSLGVRGARIPTSLVGLVNICL